MQNRTKTAVMVALASLACAVCVGSVPKAVLVPSPDAIEAPFCLDASEPVYTHAKNCLRARVYLRFSDTRAELKIRTSQGGIFKDYSIRPEPMYNRVRIEYAGGVGVLNVSILSEYFIPDTSLLEIEAKVEDEEFRIYIGGHVVFSDPAAKNSASLKITKLGVRGKSAYQWMMRK